VAETLIAVASNKFAEARPEALWTPGADCGWYEVLPLRTALEQSWPTDAHFVTCIAVRDGAPVSLQPRLRKERGAVDELRRHGVEIRHYFCAADVDTIEHAAMTDEQRADVAHRLHGRMDLIWYPTRAGVRVLRCYDATEPLSPEQQEAHAIEFQRELQALLGNRWKVDGTCTAWNWHFRLPFVVRDGTSTTSEIHWSTVAPTTPTVIVAPGVASVFIGTETRHVPADERAVRARAWLTARPVHRHGGHECHEGVVRAVWAVRDGFGVDAQASTDLVRDWAHASACPNLEDDLAGALPGGGAPSLKLLNDPDYARTPRAPIADAPGLHVQLEGEDGGYGDEGIGNGKPREAPEVPLAPTPPIVLSTKEGAVNDEVVAALATNDRSIFQLDRQLVTVGRYTRQGPLAIVPLATNSIQERITRVCDLQAWHITKTIQELRPAHPPGWMAAQISTRGVWRGIRHLTGIISTPTLRPDGTILQGSTPRYDKGTCLLYVPDGEYPVIPDEPSEDEARTSLARLKAPYRQFPFRSSRDLTSHIASAMTVPLRWAVIGSIPICLYEGSDVASGKTLLVHCCSIAGTGQTAPEITYTLDETDLRKLIFTRIAEGAAIALFDNIPPGMPFGGAVLEAYATSEFFADRVLGESRSKTLPTKSMMIYATGNNIALSREIPRRLLPIYLEPTDPERTVRAFPDILAHMREHRREVLTDILCIARAYIAAGRPAVPGCHWGSFQAWADLIARPLVWLGEEDPCLGHLEKLQSDDAPTTREAQLLGAWFDLYGNRPVLAATVLDHAQKARKTPDPDNTGEGELRLARSIEGVCRVKVAGEFPNSVAFGNKLRTLRNAVRAGYRLLDTGEKIHQATLWKVERMTPAEMSLDNV
jgi:hypothetical protein